MDRVLRPLPFGHGRLAAPYDGPEGAVVPALLDEKDLVAPKEPRRFDPLEAHRAEAFGFIRVRFFHEVIHSCRQQDRTRGSRGYPCTSHRYRPQSGRICCGRGTFPGSRRIASRRTRRGPPP